MSNVGFGRGFRSDAHCSRCKGRGRRRRDSQRLVSCEAVETVVDALIHSRDAAERRLETTSGDPAASVCQVFHEVSDYANISDKTLTDKDLRDSERVGFEPTCPLRDKTLSRRPRYDHFGTSPYGLLRSQPEKPNQAGLKACTTIGGNLRAKRTFNYSPLNRFSRGPGGRRPQARADGSRRGGKRGARCCRSRRPARCR